MLFKEEIIVNHEGLRIFIFRRSQKCNKHSSVDRQRILNKNISPGHLLKALLHKDIGLAPFLEGLGKDIFYLEEWAEVRIESYPKSSKVEETSTG